MNLFSQASDRTNPLQIQQIKTWMSEILAFDRDIPISINQLQCREPGCPPVETVIAVLTTPPQQYKIHKPISQIERADIQQLHSTI